MADSHATPTTTEEWRDVPGSGGFYQASSLGRIRSVNRTIPGPRGGEMHLKGRVLKSHTMQSGHLCVNIMGKTRYVHRLVMAAFVGAPPDSMEVCHNNGVPSDNRLENLRYGTRSDNLYDMVKHGTHAGKEKETCNRGHLLRDPNLVPSRMVHGGHRNCLACSRARPYARYHGRLDEVEEIADSYYRKIMM